MMAPGLWPWAFNDVMTDLVALKGSFSFYFVCFPFIVAKYAQHKYSHVTLEVDMLAE